jgi:hypothetical protein
MVDTVYFRDQANSIDLTVFLSACMKSIESAKDELAKKYFYFLN